MRIAVLGTGVVGQTLAGGLADLGHEVTMGTRDVEAISATVTSSTWATSAPPVARKCSCHSGCA
jgi:predicted dinucleotide-binding enzyme